MNNKLEHLKLIQNIITRMATNSFYLKGWTVTLVSAFIALIISSKNFMYLIVAIIPLIIFFILDGFYLRQEKLYRKLYDVVRQKEEEEIDFSMETTPFKSEVDSWFITCFSRTLIPFYCGIILIVISILIIA